MRSPSSAESLLNLMDAKEDKRGRRMVMMVQLVNGCHFDSKLPGYSVPQLSVCVFSN